MFVPFPFLLSHSVLFFGFFPFALVSTFLFLFFFGLFLFLVPLFSSPLSCFLIFLLYLISHREDDRFHASLGSFGPGGLRRFSSSQKGPCPAGETLPSFSAVKRAPPLKSQPALPGRKPKSKKGRPLPASKN